MRQTKIIATVGPASDSDETLDALLAAGADVFRLNFSHGTHETHAATYQRIRQASARAKREVAVLQDLGGPKIRTGRLEGGRPITLTRGETLRIATGDIAGNVERISTTFAGLAKNAHPGDRLLLSDGTIELLVESSDGAEIVTKVVEGGVLGQHKGINAPGIELPESALTPKDIEDLRFGLALGMDLVALSFVQCAADLQAARAVIAEAGAKVTVIAKIERPKAVENLDEILSNCDAVMIARGDLGLEMPLEQVPRAQKEIIGHARARDVPVILATQVLESMTIEGRPTRAEVSDAANAVDESVDAIMLAGETASGAYPVRSVETLDRIIRDAESFGVATRAVSPSSPARDHVDAICQAAVTLAEQGNAEAIIAVTRGGHTARRLSAFRPRVPVIATTDTSALARQLTLNWGIFPLTATLVDRVDDVGTFVGRTLIERKLVKAGAIVVLVSIHPDRGRVDANYLKLQRF
ncbi:MAG: pyruvate kinase [Acidobacteriaceae bacterium]|jgi:pyruvate kinase|nr:pyruvate kinase [Acidobacteriaceae bacterium]